MKHNRRQVAFDWQCPIDTELTGPQQQKAPSDPTRNSALTAQPAISRVTSVLVILYGRPANFISWFNCFFSVAHIISRLMGGSLCWITY